VESFKFKDDEKKELRPETQEFIVPFSGGSYSVTWTYEKETNLFKRLLSGAPHKDKISGNQLVAKNVIIQFTNVVDRAGLDTQVEAIGSGKADFYIDGKLVNGKWSKPDASSRTKYTDLGGNEIVLNAGTTWIEVVKK